MLPPISTPGRDFTTEPVAMMALSKVIFLPSSSPSTIASSLSETNSPRPWISWILFFFIR